jgi:methionine synthase I (cobalamin-dependent)
MTYDGYDYVDACRTLADNGAAIVGLNCSRGPATMLPLLEHQAGTGTVGLVVKLDEAPPSPARRGQADPRLAG